MLKQSHPPIRRLIYIDEAVRENQYPNRTTIAREFEVDRKTIQRDIDFMRDQLKAPIEFDSRKNGYYYTEADYFLPALHITEKDVFAFKIAELVLKPYEKSKYFGEIRRGFEKILQYLPENISVDSLESSFSFEDGREGSQLDSTTMSALRDAILHHLQVNITYHSFSSSEVKQRLVDPYCLINRHNYWYLIAHCHARDAVLMFAVPRILTLEMTDTKFKKPKEFSPQQYLGESFALERGGEKYGVVLKFSSYQASWIKERQWHPSQKIVVQADGTILFSINVRGLKEVMRWVLQYGSEVEVLEPKNLREMVAAETKKMAAIYRKR